MLKLRTQPAVTPDVDERTPTGITITIGVAVLVGSAVAAAFAPSGDPSLRLALVTLAVTSFAMASQDWAAVAAVLPLAWLIYDGFLLDRYGVLAWRGWSDVIRIGVLVVAAVLGLAAGALRRRLQDRRARWVLGAEVHSLAQELIEEMGRG